MRDRLRTAYLWLSLPLLAWLLYAWADLRLCQAQTIAAAAHRHSFSLRMAEEHITHGLRNAERGEWRSASQDLELARARLAEAEYAAEIYSAGLDRWLPHSLGVQVPSPSFRVFTTSGQFYDSILLRISWEVAEEKLSCSNVELLEAIRHDIRLMRETLTEELLIRANKEEIRGASAVVREALHFPTLLRGSPGTLQPYTR